MGRIRTVEDLIAWLSDKPLNAEVQILDDYCLPVEIAEVIYDEDRNEVLLSY